MKQQKTKISNLCPCQSGKAYSDCCQPFVEMKSNAATAEKLMRSRYTAFVLLNEDYLRYSWHPEKCPEIIHLNSNAKWLGLKIKKIVAGGKHDNSGEVEFVARNKINGKASRLHENSLFVRLQNRWLYVSGKIND